MSAQLSLNIRFKDGSSFENFFPGRNLEAVDRLRAAVESACRGGDGAERLLFLAGDEGHGKTHLLQAACRRVQRSGRTGVYVPLAEAHAFAPAMLEDMETASLLCLDDVHGIAGDAAWERALFSLCERARSAGALLLASGTAVPARLGLNLPDLVTRLAWGPVYTLHALDDEEKLAAMQLRARNRGLKLPDDVARYILSRYPRHPATLFEFLERLDRDSLVRQRRLTIPFIRSLEEGGNRRQE